MERIPPQMIARYREYLTQAREQEREARRALYPSERRTFSIFIAGQKRGSDAETPSRMTHGGGPRE